MTRDGKNCDLSALGTLSLADAIHILLDYQNARIAMDEGAIGRAFEEMPQTADPRTAMERAIDGLRSEVDSYEKSLSHLRSKLQTVLVPEQLEGSNKAECGAPKPAQSDLSEQIEGIAMRLYHRTRELNSITDRLDVPPLRGAQARPVSGD